MKDHLISFDDTKTAFKSRTDKELRRAYWLFKIISFNWLVNIGPPFLKFALWAHLPVKSLIRSTIYRQFCGGETISECQDTINALAKDHIGTILDYSVEGKEKLNDFNNALNETLSSISLASRDRNIPFCVFKPTGFTRFELLEKKNAGNKFSPEEEAEFSDFKVRIEKICRLAFDHNVPVFIDAEESWIQDAVDEMATELMLKYNRERVLIYNTLQMYRIGRVEYLEECIRHGKENNYKPGFKIVRGAYMEKERKRAQEKNLLSPIQPDKNATDKDYDAAIRICVENIDNLSLCCGTHNEESSLLLVELMDEKKLPAKHPGIWFSQLYGMSDHISYNLAEKGYNVCKYVPYGPVEDVLPYLIRRAQENTSVKGQTGRELALIQEEMDRRRNTI